MHVLLPCYEREDLPLVIETTRDMSKLPVGPMNLDWIGFTPVGYDPNPSPKQLPKQLPKEEALRQLKEWHDWYCNRYCHVIERSCRELA